MAEKVTFELKAHHTVAEVAVGHNLVRLEEGKPYTTADPNEIGALDMVPWARRTEKKQEGKS